MPDRARRPLIAVTGPRRGALAPRRLVQLAVFLAGGRTRQIGPGRKQSAEGFDGVVVTGGHDIDPVLYAEESQVQPRYDKERDAFESAVIDDALAREQPLLGICRGAQLLNVRLGGSLHQDISNRRRKSKRRTILPAKTIAIEPGTRLRDILGDPNARVNCLHRQAIDRLGDGLAISARDEDDIVQGIEHPRHDFLIGTQWHPEYLIYQPAQWRLFERLVTIARSRL